MGYPEEMSKKGLLLTIKESIENFYTSLDKFTKLFLLFVIIFVLITPFILYNRLTIKQEASLSTPVTSPLWTSSDDGAFITAENSLYKVKFAYGGKAQGWFGGAPTTGCNRTDTQTGGGGCDGAIVELYYKPTDSTISRNLIFRNGTWGNTYDALDEWEAEDGNSVTSKTTSDFNSPDYSSNRQGTVIAHSFKEDAGRFWIDFTVNFKSWQIIRHYILYPNGKITVAADIKLVTPGKWFYIGHRFNFAGSLYSFSCPYGTCNWGGHYQNDSDHFMAWSDGIQYNNGTTCAANGNFPWIYDIPVVQDWQIKDTKHYGNYVAHFGRQDGTAASDAFTGFYINSSNGNDPDLMVMNADTDTCNSPINRISQAVGSIYHPYDETAMYSFSWAPNDETQLSHTWFYMTSTYDNTTNTHINPGTWGTSLGTWRETFNIFLLPDSKYDKSDVLPVWQEEANQLPQEQPTNITGATSAYIDPIDKIYHFVIPSGTQAVSFNWKRVTSRADGKAQNYYTSFMMKGLGVAPAISVTDANGVQQAGIKSYYNPVSDIVLIIFDFDQPATPMQYTVFAQNPSTLTPTLTPTSTSALTPTLTPIPTPTIFLTPTPTPTLIPSLADTTPPTVSITSPLNGANLPRKGIVSVDTTASDASGIFSIQIQIDSKVVVTCSFVTTCSYSWNVHKLSTGIHTITATATDNSVNKNTNSVSINVYE